MKNILLVGIGGAFGSIARYLVSLGYNKFQGVAQGFPYPTFIVNLVGCILIGLFMAHFTKNQTIENEPFKFFLVTGICGGFTTFSTFSFESFQLIQNQQSTTAIIYVLASVLIGVTLTFVSYSLYK